MRNIAVKEKKELLYLKIKSAKEDSKPLVKRSLEYSFLNDYAKIKNIVKNAITTLEKPINLQNIITVLILTHPTLDNIYVYSKEQWQLYYNYKIIEQCINNKIVKVKYELLDKSEYLKNYRKNKRKVIKYIIQNIPINLFSKIFLKFLKEKEEITKQFEYFFIQELINEVPKLNDKIVKKDTKLDDIEMNLNLNNLINNEETEESSLDVIEKKLQKEKLFPQLDKEYLLHSNDFIKTLEEQFKMYSEKQINLYKIKEIIGEDNNDKIENENIGLKTSLKMNLEGSISNLSLFEDENFESNNKDNNVLLTQMNPPPNYVKKLLSDDNFFKKLDKEEYYIGIEQFKDELNRQLLISTKTFD